MKDILAIVTGGAHDELRLNCATDICRIFGSHLTVAVVNELPSPQVYAAADPSFGVAAADADVRAAAMSRGQELKQWAEDRLARLSSPASVLAINDFKDNLGPALCEYSRLSDLMVATLPTLSSHADLMNVAIDSVLIEGACPILCLPHEPANVAMATHAVVAWNGSRKSARALNGSFSLLRHVKKVTVLQVDQALRQAGAASGPGDEVLVRLKHQGIEADLDRVSSEGLLTADAIIAEVRRLGADLLILGAQAEGGIRQWFQNSVSRQILTDAKMPIMIAN